MPGSLKIVVREVSVRGPRLSERADKLLPSRITTAPGESPGTLKEA